MATDAPFGRVVTAMVTPFTATGGVDYDEAVRLAEYLLSHGSDALVVAGTTGESPTLTHDEKLQLFRVIKTAVGSGTKIIAGTSSYSTADSVSLSQEAQDTGVDALLCVTPPYNKPSQEGMFQHFCAIAEAVTLPIMLYNVPPRTGVNLEPATTLRLTAVPNIIALKEAGAVDQVGAVVAAAPAHFAVYSGADENNLTALVLGGVGTVSVIAHVVGPDLQKMHQAFFTGDMETARRLHLQTLPMTRAMFSAPNPVPTKTALAMLDVLPHSSVRLPLVEATERERSVIHAALKEYGLLRA